MRLLRLDLANGRSTIDLHPFVTVASGLPPAELDELLETVRRLARGSTAGIRGLVQNQGILVDLDGYGDDRVLAITGANVVIDCDVAATMGIAGLRAQIEHTTRREEIDAVVVEEIRADLDPAARARVALLQAELGPDDAASLAKLDEEIERLAGSIGATTALSPILQEATEEILELRRQWAEHDSRRAAAEGHFATLMSSVKYAEDRAVLARGTAERARDAAKPVLLSRTEEARLEALSFPDQDHSRKGRWKKVLRPEEEQEKLALLGRVGVETWTAYTMYRAAPTSSPDKIAAAKSANLALAEAESMLNDARSRLASDELTAELNSTEDSIRADARSHLGHLLPADVGAALQELVVERPNPAWLEAVRKLNEQLPSIEPPTVESATSPIEADLSVDEAHRVVVAAERWLDTKKRERADIDFDRLRAELHDATRLLHRHEQALTRLERAEAAVASSRRRLAELRDLLAAHSEGAGGAVDAILALVAPVVAQVEHEADGSVPVAVVGRFETLGDGDVRRLMDELGQYGDQVQILVVSEHPALATWAKEAGLDRAILSRPKSGDRPTAA
ncbi:MAG: hypothetical protein ACR2QO_26695 [Acidimicrobiales bacterium]